MFSSDGSSKRAQTTVSEEIWAILHLFHDSFQEGGTMERGFEAKAPASNAVCVSVLRCPRHQSLSLWNQKKYDGCECQNWGLMP